MNAVQTSLLVVAGLMLALFIKYKIAGSVRREFSLIGKGLNRGYELFAGVACVGAMASAACAGLVVYSILMPPAETDRVVITTRHKTPDDSGYSYGVTVVGRKTPGYHPVSGSFYDKAREGDTVEVTLNRFFRDWRDARILRDGKVVYSKHGPDWFGLVMAAVFLLPVYSFRLFFKMREKRGMGSFLFVVIILFELIPLGIMLSRW